MATKSVSVKFVTPATSEWMFCYVNAFEPKAFENQAPKYSVCVLIPKSDEAGLAAFKVAYEKCKEANKAMLANANGVVPATFKNPVLKDGDEAVANGAGEEFAGHWFFNASATVKNNPNGIMVWDKSGKTLDATEFYSGCKGRISGNFFAYNTGTAKGISFGLGALCKTADGENNFSGSNSSASDFGISPFDSSTKNDEETDF